MNKRKNSKNNTRVSNRFSLFLKSNSLSLSDFLVHCPLLQIDEINYSRELLETAVHCWDLSSDERTSLFNYSTHCCLEMYSWSEGKSVSSSLLDLCRLSATGLSIDRSNSSNAHWVSFSSWLCLGHSRSNSVSRSSQWRTTSEKSDGLVSLLKPRVALSSPKNHVHPKDRFEFIWTCRRFLWSISRTGS